MHPNGIGSTVAREESVVGVGVRQVPAHNVTPMVTAIPLEVGATRTVFGGRAGTCGIVDGGAEHTGIVDGYGAHSASGFC